jgi:hypothetical protein
MAAVFGVHVLLVSSTVSGNLPGVGLSRTLADAALTQSSNLCRGAKPSGIEMIDVKWVKLDLPRRRFELELVRNRERPRELFDVRKLSLEFAARYPANPTGHPEVKLTASSPKGASTPARSQQRANSPEAVLREPSDAAASFKLYLYPDLIPPSAQAGKTSIEIERTARFDFRQNSAASLSIQRSCVEDFQCRRVHRNKQRRVSLRRSLEKSEGSIEMRHSLFQAVK